MVKRNELEKFLNTLLKQETYKDLCPNGIQVEGKETIKKIAFAVSASKNEIEKAVAWKADALIVHHGILWSYQGGKPLKGPFLNRIKPLIQSEMNLFAYHLPLDGHETHGNAAVIGNELSLKNQKSFGEYKGSFLGIKGEFSKSISVEKLQQKLEKILNHPVLLSSPDVSEQIKSIAIVTGGGKDHWQEALSLGIDAYLTGEITEYTWHDAKEAGIHLFAGGHHATERFGVLSLEKLLKQKFNVETKFFDSENPI